MTIRGGGNPHSAMAAMPLREWTRRLGALPAEAYDCFMVGTPYGFNRIQAWVCRRGSGQRGGAPALRRRGVMSVWCSPPNRVPHKNGGVPGVGAGQRPPPPGTPAHPTLVFG